MTVLVTKENFKIAINSLLSSTGLAGWRWVVTDKVKDIVGKDRQQTKFQLKHTTYPAHVNMGLNTFIHCAITTSSYQ